MRSTAEWEAALEGTTPGPWGYYTPRGRDGHYDPIFGATPGDEIALVKPPADWKVMAMVPEAVAEVVRLRRELEERVRIWQKVAEKLENRGDKDGASQARHTVSVVTRILEATE